MIESINISALIPALLILFEIWFEVFFNDKHKTLSKTFLALSFASSFVFSAYILGVNLGVLGAIKWLLLRFAIFSPFWAIGKGKDWTYLGNASQIDIFEKTLDQDKLKLARLSSLILYISL